jgi:hypothetical protein
MPSDEFRIDLGHRAEVCEFLIRQLKGVRV